MGEKKDLMHLRCDKKLIVLVCTSLSGLTKSLKSTHSV